MAGIGTGAGHSARRGSTGVDSPGLSAPFFSRPPMPGCKKQKAPPCGAFCFFRRRRPTGPEQGGSRFPVGHRHWNFPGARPFGSINDVAGHPWRQDCPYFWQMQALRALRYGSSRSGDSGPRVVPAPAVTELRAALASRGVVPWRPGVASRVAQAVRRAAADVAGHPDCATAIYCRRHWTPAVDVTAGHYHCPGVGDAHCRDHGMDEGHFHGRSHGTGAVVADADGKDRYRKAGKPDSHIRRNRSCHSRSHRSRRGRCTAPRASRGNSHPSHYRRHSRRWHNRRGLPAGRRQGSDASS